MASIKVINHLDGLAADARRVAVSAAAKMVPVVERNVEQGKQEMKGIAAAADGRHGKAYPNRITSEMLGPLTGEFGPHAGGTPVGAGFRHGVNTDVEKTADVVGPKFADDVSAAASDLFWGE